MKMTDKIISERTLKNHKFMMKMIKSNYSQIFLFTLVTLNLTGTIKSQHLNETNFIRDTTLPTRQNDLMITTPFPSTTIVLNTQSSSSSSSSMHIRQIVGISRVRRFTSNPLHEHVEYQNGYSISSSNTNDIVVETTQAIIQTSQSDTTHNYYSHIGDKQSSESLETEFDLNSTIPATDMLYVNRTCDDENCYPMVDHHSACVGDLEFCHLTYSQYVDMLYEYIYPTTPEWILIISHSIVFIMGLVGNALVCIAVYTNHSMRNVTNIFIVNLAVADFFVILFCLPPTVVWDVTETWFMGKTMCKIVLYFQNVSVTVSVLTLTFISIDRWYAICFPLRYVSTNERAIGSIALIWTIALLSDIPEFLVLTTKRKNLRFDIKLFTQCMTTWDLESEKLFYIIKFVFLYLLPLLFMSIAYIQIIRVLWKSDTIPGHRESRNVPPHSCGYVRNSCGPANSSTMGQLRARRKAAKMLVAVVLMFASCYFPVHVLNILRYTINIGQSEVIAVLSLFSHWLCYANSAINPVIYNFMSGKFRREFKHALEKCRCIGTTRGRVEDRSLYHSTPGTRINNISPSSRSNYQLTSVRDITRVGQTLQTSFNDNGGGNGYSIHNNHIHQQQPSDYQTIIDDKRIKTTSIDQTP